jgi:hypothetical protein
MCAELVRTHSYKNKQLYNLYYNKSKNEFNVKRSENTNFYIPLRWKHVYRHVHFYNPETKEKISVTEPE